MSETPSDEKKPRYIVLVILLFGLIIGLVFWWSRSSPPLESQTAPRETVSQKPVDYFELLRQARKQLRESDGYLLGAYQRLVAAGRPEALIKFISHNISGRPRRGKSQLEECPPGSAMGQPGSLAGWSLAHLESWPIY